MDPNTGRIYTPEEIEKMDAEATKELVEIRKDELSKVRKMNRKQRRAWASAKQRKKREAERNG